MAKYKVGDKVRIKNSLKTGEYYDQIYFTRFMATYLGSIVKIRDVYNNNTYRIDEDNTFHLWTESMLEDILPTKNNKEANTMFEKFMQLFNLEEDKEFNFSNDGHRYRIHNDELQTICSELEDSGWYTVNKDAKYHLIAKAILGEIQIKWKPKKGDDYFIVDIDDIESFIWENNATDIALYKMGNCFKTEEDAEKHREEILNKIEEC